MYMKVKLENSCTIVDTAYSTLVISSMTKCKAKLLLILWSSDHLVERDVQLNVKC